MAAGHPTTKFQGVQAPYGTWLDVVYTNDDRTLKWVLDMYEGWLAASKHRFVGLDLEYTETPILAPNVMPSPL